MEKQIANEQNKENPFIEIPPNNISPEELTSEFSISSTLQNVTFSGGELKFHLKLKKSSGLHKRCERSYGKWQCIVPFPNVVDEDRGEHRGYDLSMEAARGVTKEDINRIEEFGYLRGFSPDVECCAERDYGNSGIWEADLTIYFKTVEGFAEGTISSGGGRLAKGTITSGGGGK